MPVKSSRPDADYRRFEEDILNVLKRDGDHRLDFDDGLLIKSSRLHCTVVAKDVHYDEASGDIILVGAFRSGEPVYDESHSYPVRKSFIELPLRECYEDLEKTSGMHENLLDKARQACIRKYAEEPFEWFEKVGMVDDGCIDFTRLGLSKPVHFSFLDVNSMRRFESGQLVFKVSCSMDPDMTVSPDYGRTSRLPQSVNMVADHKGMSYTDLQDIGFELFEIREMVRKAMHVYSGRRHELQPLSASLSERDERELRCRSLVAVYDAGYPLPICHRVARHMVGEDAFDTTRNSVSDIRRRMERWRRGDISEPVAGKGPKM